MKIIQRINLESAFVGMPESSYDVLTFGELEEGDRFIGLPVPGDNGGHGGFRVAHNLFIKVNNNYDHPNCLRENKSLHCFSRDMPVIKIAD